MKHVVEQYTDFDGYVAFFGVDLDPADHSIRIIAAIGTREVLTSLSSSRLRPDIPHGCQFPPAELKRLIRFSRDYSYDSNPFVPHARFDWDFGCPRVYRSHRTLVVMSWKHLFGGFLAALFALAVSARTRKSRSLDRQFRRREWLSHSQVRKTRSLHRQSRSRPRKTCNPAMGSHSL